jgi:hypothetical protein
MVPVTADHAGVLSGWKALALELHAQFCLDNESGPPPDWQAAESCTAFAWAVWESDSLAALRADPDALRERVEAVEAERDDAVTRLERMRQHAISDPEMRTLHESAKQYALAVRALNAKRGGQLSTTLAFLIEHDYLVSNDPRAVLDADPSEGDVEAMRQAVYGDVDPSDLRGGET